MADELGFGVRLSPYTLTTDQVRSAVCQVLADKSYHERILRMAYVSKRYNGSVTAAKICYEHALSANLNVNKKMN